MKFLKNKKKNVPANKIDVALLGDSTIDNGWYVGEGLDVPTYVQLMLGASHRVTSKALDGAVTNDVWVQLHDIPDTAEHLILSVGGNDALGAHKTLFEKTESVGQGLARIGSFVERFREDYSALLDEILTRGIPLTVFTIYNGSFDGGEKAATTTAVRLYNDVIQSEANRRGVEVVDLRDVVSDPRDFYNSIEPGNLGGAKFATEIVSRILPNENQDDGHVRSFRSASSGRNVGKSVSVASTDINAEWMDEVDLTAQYHDLFGDGDVFADGELDITDDDELAEFLLPSMSGNSAASTSPFDSPDGVDDLRFDTVMATEIGGIRGLGRRGEDL